MTELNLEYDFLKVNGVAVFFYRKRGVALGRFLSIWHGLPGNPLDHSMHNYDYWLNAGFTIVIANYFGTKASEGTYSIDSCVETIDVVSNLLKNGEGISLRKNDFDGEKLSWNFEIHILSGSSMGGGLVLLAAIKNPDLKNIIAISPALNTKTQGDKELFLDEDVISDKLFKFVAKQYLWRVDPDFQARVLAREDLFRVEDAIDGLKNKKIFLIHSKFDKVVSVKRSEFLQNRLKDAQFEVLDSSEHVTNYVLGSNNLSKKIFRYFNLNHY